MQEDLSLCSFMVVPTSCLPCARPSCTSDQLPRRLWFSHRRSLAYSLIQPSAFLLGRSKYLYLHSLWHSAKTESGSISPSFRPVENISHVEHPNRRQLMECPLISSCPACHAGLSSKSSSPDNYVQSELWLFPDPHRYAGSIPDHPYPSDQRCVHRD
jgi:hypothetical protein